MEVKSFSPPNHKWIGYPKNTIYMKYKVTIEIETPQRKELIEPYIKYSLKMVKIINVKVEETK